MGNCQIKDKCGRSPRERAVEGLKNKARLLQGEINEISCIREAENQVYERELMDFAFKEGEWERERTRLKEEVKKLRKVLEEKEERMRWTGHQCGRDELGLVMGTSTPRNCCFLEHVKEENARRDETVEKWKHLYFAIKAELDDLIQRTHEEERLCRRTEEDLVVELLKELKDKEEIVELLQAKLATMEHQESKREREMDILRQSLRIMSYRKRATKLGQRSIKKSSSVDNIS